MGYPPAQYNWAWTHLEGKDVERNEVLGSFWMEKSARQGYAQAEYVMGHDSYYGNERIRRDKEQAQYWLKRAAKQGYRLAEEFLMRKF